MILRCDAIKNAEKIDVGDANTMRYKRNVVSI